ncbi:response regulator [Aquipseudomonas guryensis]|uniref:Sensory/regulatory protein RpfC n=1 Tax=Aquipseudomonas guryensis TaxID=2759165 RepID=A0A7W4D8V4_9GAMM|nr:response regulator [Pseudomonas guryensis]MBB1518131.1 response regulator [Pseudomonas guryensis]
MNSRQPPLLREALLLALCYAGAALLALYLTRQPSSMANLWPANAIACAFLVMHPLRRWPLLLLAVALTNIACELLFGDALRVALYFTAVNLCEIALAAWLVQRCGMASAFTDNPRALLTILLNGCFWPALAGASLGALALSQMQMGSYRDLWLSWFASACTGAVAVLPLALIWRQRGSAALLAALDPLLTPALLMLSMGVSILALLFLPFPFVYLSVPLILTALYLNVINVALFNLCVALLVSALLSFGYFIPPPFIAQWQHLLLYLPILVVMLPALLLASSLQQARLRESDFRISEQRFRGALAFAGTGVALANSQGQICEANSRLCEMFGYPRAQLLGMHHLDLSHPDDRTSSHDKLAELLAGEIAYYALDKRLLRHDGQPFWAHVTVAHLPGHDGADELIVQIDDINDKVEAQHKLNLLRIAAEKANRTKSEFLANMSREIRTPMNGVLGIAHLLGNTELNATQRKYLDMLRDAGKSLLAVISDILDFSKIEAGRLQLEPVRFELQELLRQMASLMTLLAGNRDVELLIQVTPEVPQQLHADRQRLQQVLVNLVANAIKYTQQGEVELRIELQASGEGRQLLFSVIDTGIGMSQTQLNNLHEVFTQEHASQSRRHTDVGLGLEISARLVELMGGRMAVRSTPSQGSAFQFSLPLANHLDGPPLPDLPEQFHGLRVLLVDDNQKSRQILLQLLESLHCQVDQADSGSVAHLLLQQAGAAQQPYDLLLVDWNMAELNGLQTLAMLAESSPTALPPSLLMVNAFAREHLTANGRQLPVNDLLLKPVIRSSLLGALQEILSQPHTTPSSEPAPRRELQAMRILLVEDNLLDQIVTQGILEQQGARLTLASDGRHAIDLLRQQPEAFDLVLMDVQMPGMDGITATRIIRQDLRLRLPVVAMSAGVSHAERAECEQAGMDLFIAKPVDISALLSNLKRLRYTPGDLKTIGAHLPLPGESSALLAVDTLDLLCTVNPQMRQSLRALVKELIARGNEPLRQTAQALQEGREADAISLIHTLRGSLGSLGAISLPPMSLRLEDAIRRGDQAQIELQLQLLDNELDGLLRAFNDWLRQRTLGRQETIE